MQVVNSNYLPSAPKFKIKELDKINEEFLFKCLLLNGERWRVPVNKKTIK